jgi:hypothetical protein
LAIERVLRPAAANRTIRARFKSRCNVIGERLDPSLMQPIIPVAARYGIIPKSFPAGDAVAELP